MNQPFSSIQLSSVTQSCPILCNPMDCSTPGLPIHHQLPELTQTRVRWVGDAIQPSHPLPSPSSPTFNLSQHQGLFKQLSSSHQMAKVLEPTHQRENRAGWMAWHLWLRETSPWNEQLFKAVTLPGTGHLYCTTTWGRGLRGSEGRSTERRPSETLVQHLNHPEDRSLRLHCY